MDDQQATPVNLHIESENDQIHAARQHIPVKSEVEGLSIAPMTDTDSQRPTNQHQMSDVVGQDTTMPVTAVGHDPDLPEKSDRHNLSTYEVGKIFEEASCRVSERTITRWCNKNKNGVRRLDCAFDEGERKYYISEDSVKKVIREERQKGRLSNPFEADLSDIDHESITTDRQQHSYGDQNQQVTDVPVGRISEMSDNDRHNENNVSDIDRHERKSADFEELEKVVGTTPRVHISAGAF